MFALSFAIVNDLTRLTKNLLNPRRIQNRAVRARSRTRDPENPTPIERPRKRLQTQNPLQTKPPEQVASEGITGRIEDDKYVPEFQEYERIEAEYFKIKTPYGSELSQEILRLTKQQGIQKLTKMFLKTFYDLDFFNSRLSLKDKEKKLGNFFSNFGIWTISGNTRWTMSSPPPFSGKLHNRIRIHLLRNCVSAAAPSMSINQLVCLSSKRQQNLVGSAESCLNAIRV